METKKEQKVVKIKEQELYSMINEHLNGPEKYDSRKQMISELKGAEHSLTNTIQRLEDAYDHSKQLEDDELHIGQKLNKCYGKVRKELTELRDILEEVKAGDRQPVQQMADNEPESLQQEGGLE